MIRSARAYDANERVVRYQNSISRVQSNILLFKGYLGETVKDKPELPSVGQHSARRAGVIIDAMGKFRCPPGTPNANELTDMQMSNCMKPSAEMIAEKNRNASLKMEKMIDGASKILSDKNLKHAKKVNALVSLLTLDAQDGDNPIADSSSAIIGINLFKIGGFELIKFASDSLHIRNKISDEIKNTLDKMASHLKDGADIHGIKTYNVDVQDSVEKESLDPLAQSNEEKPSELASNE